MSDEKTSVVVHELPAVEEFIGMVVEGDTIKLQYRPRRLPQSAARTDPTQEHVCQLRLPVDQARELFGLLENLRQRFLVH